MDPMTAMAASGMRSRMESLDLLANNIANASTGGYKADREFYSLYIAPEVTGASQPETDMAVMPIIERPTLIFHKACSKPPATLWMSRSQARASLR